MPLPDGFNSFEHLQDTIRKILRKEVLEEFKDIDTDDLSINVARNSLRTACLPDDKDTGVMLLMRALLYFVILRKVQDLQPVIAGIPLEDYAQKVTFRPQITLFFQESAEEVEKGFSPLRSQISVRLINETSESLTESKLIRLGQKIKSEFDTGGKSFWWRRGKVSCYYKDKEKGYRFTLYATTKNEGKRVIEKVLSLVDELFKKENYSSSQNEDPSSAFPILPDTANILGKSRRLPRKRPVGKVHFTYATAEIYGLSKPVLLYSSSFRFRNALVN